MIQANSNIEGCDVVELISAAVAGRANPPHWLFVTDDEPLLQQSLERADLPSAPIVAVPSAAWETEGGALAGLADWKRENSGTTTIVLVRSAMTLQPARSAPLPLDIVERTRTTLSLRGAARIEFKRWAGIAHGALGTSEVIALLHHPEANAFARFSPESEELESLTTAQRTLAPQHD